MWHAELASHAACSFYLPGSPTELYGLNKGWRSDKKLCMCRPQALKATTRGRQAQAPAAPFTRLRASQHPQFAQQVLEVAIKSIYVARISVEMREIADTVRRLAVERHEACLA